MKFKAEPNLFVRFAKEYVRRITGKKGIQFDDKGEYETKNEYMIKILSQNFEVIKEENNAIDAEIKSEEIKIEPPKSEIKPRTKKQAPKRKSKRK